MKINLINRFKNLIRKEDVFENMTLTSPSFYDEFYHILEFINERTNANFKFKDSEWDLVGKDYSYLLLEGNYESETDSEINSWEEVDFRVFTRLVIHFNPERNEYKVKHIVPLKEYRDFPEVSDNLTFHDLMIYLNTYLESGKKSIA